MAEQLVSRLLPILKVFCARTDKQISKTKLYKATGSHDKPSYYKNVNYLLDSNIVKIEHKGSQTHLVSLTELGYEIISFIQDIEKSSNAYGTFTSKLQRICAEYHESTKRTGKIDTRSASKLRFKGWEPDEIRMLPTLVQSVISILHLYRKIFCNSLFARFFFINRKYSPNKKAMDILQVIILENISSYFFKKPEVVDTDIFKKEISPIFGNLSGFDEIVKDEILDFFVEIGFAYLHNRFVSNEIANLLISSLTIAKTKGGAITDFLEVMDYTLKKPEYAENPRLLSKLNEGIEIANKYKQMNYEFCRQTFKDGYEEFIMTKVIRNRILDAQNSVRHYYNNLEQDTKK